MFIAIISLFTPLEVFLSDGFLLVDFFITFPMWTSNGVYRVKRAGEQTLLSLTGREYLMSFRIRTKLIIAFFGIIFPFTIIAGTLVFYNASTFRKAAHKVEIVSEERAAITNIILALERALMPGNDYIITGDRKYIDDFNRVSDDVEKRMKEAEGIVSGAEDMNMMGDTKVAWRNIKDISQKIFEIQAPQGNKAAASLMEEMDYIWAYPAIERLKKWRGMHLEEYKKAANISHKVWVRSWISMGIVVALLIISGVSFAIFYSNLFVKPIEAIHNGADEIAKGNFKTRFDIKTGDELQQLSNAMNEMAVQLDSFTSNLQGMVEERTRELRFERDKLVRIFETMEDGVYLVDQDYNIQYLNPVLLKEFGPMEGKKCYTYFHDRTEVCPWCPNQRVFAGETVSWEWSSSKSGKTYDLLDTPLRQPDGSIWKLEIFREITEKKKMEEAFRTLVGTAAANIGAVFFHETVSSLCTWLGVECIIIGELVDENKVRALAMQVDGKAVEHYEYALAGTPCESATQKGYCEYHEGVVQLFPADKDLVEIRAEAYVGIPVRDKNGKVNGILCAISRHKFVPPPMVKEVFEIIAARVGTEIERKKAEEALYKSEALLKLQISRMPFGYIVWDTSFRVVSWNQAAERIFGFTLEEATGEHPYDLIVPKEAQPHVDIIWRRLLEGETTAHSINENLTKDGRTIICEWTNTPLRYHNGDVIGALSMVQDITERKKAEEKIKEQLDFLQRFEKATVQREFRIKELRDENEALKKKIQEMEKKKS